MSLCLGSPAFNKCLGRSCCSGHGIWRTVLSLDSYFGYLNKGLWFHNVLGEIKEELWEK